MKLSTFTPRHFDESFESESMSPRLMDSYWRNGWLRFGTTFTRHSFFFGDKRCWTVQPLRTRLAEFVPSKSQRRTLRKNADLTLRIRPARLDDEKRRLFENHKRRFANPNPDSLEGFLGASPERGPCETVEILAYECGRLIAASYLDIGEEGASSMHASYDLDCGHRSLGICTILWEITYARSRGCLYYYPGFAFHEPSCMDYKKQFKPMEWYNWQGQWLPLNELEAEAIPDHLPEQLELISV